MAENNATCSICGKPYHKCLSCKDSMSLKPWQVHTCSSVHYQVFQIVRGYSTNVYTKDEAREKFKNVDLSDLEDYRDNIKNVIKDILKEDKVVKVEKPVAELIDEIEKPVYSRKRKINVNNVETDVEQSVF